MEKFQHFREIAENISDIILQSDSQGRYLYVSPSHKKILGRGEEVLGRSIFEHIHPEDLERVQGVFRKYLENQEVAKIEYRYLHPEKDYVWLESVGKVVPGENITAVITSRDITSRKKNEQELSMLSQIIAQANDSIIITDTEGVILYANSISKALLEKSPEDLIGQNIKVLGENPEIGATQNEILAKTLENGSWQGEVVNYDAQGNEIFWDTRIFMIEDPVANKKFLVGISRDISERKRIMADLEYRLRLGSIFNEFSGKLINLPLEKIDENVQSILSQVGTFAQADRSYVFLYKDDSSKMRNVYEWCSEGIIPQIQNLQDVELEKQVPYFAKMVTLRRTFYAYDIEDLPAEADVDKEHFRSQDIKSLFVVPMYYQNEIWGFVGLDFVKCHKKISYETRNLLELTGHIICNILARRKRETKLEETISELQSFNALMVDRENRMIELKEEINKLLQELGREEKYRV